MATARRHSLYTAVLGYATSQTLDVKQITSENFEANIEVLDHHAAGAIDRSAAIVTSSQPEFTIETEDIAGLLTSVMSWTTGKLFDETSYLYYAQREHGDALTAGSNHRRVAIPLCYGYLEQVNADGVDQLATASLRFCVLDDDSSTPWSVDTSQALPATAPGYNSSYFNGAVFENSTEIEGVLGQTWVTGIEIRKNFRVASATPHTVAVVNRNPEFRFRLAEMSETDITDLVGRTVDTSMAFYLQKADNTYATANARVARGTASHCKASFTAGHVSVQTVGGNGNEDVMAEVTVRPTGTVTFSAASAIP